MIVFEVHVYLIKRRNLNSISWRCKEYTCSATTTTGLYYALVEIILVKGNHNHPLVYQQIAAIEHRNLIKSAAQLLDVQPRAIIREELVGERMGVIHKTARSPH
jgi:hypothetical protein